ncbi:MAG: response regulator [bacterium]
MKIFIIENDINTSHSLQAKFKVNNLEVVNCNIFLSIKEIIEQIIEAQPDYIVHGFRFPNMDGFDLLHAIKSNKETMNIPVFVYTKLSDDKSKKKCADLGAEYFFSKKELNLEQFSEKVIKIIENRSKIKK